MIKAEKSAAASLHVLGSWFKTLLRDLGEGKEKEEEDHDVENPPHHLRQPSAISAVCLNAVARHLHIFMTHTKH